MAIIDILQIKNGMTFTVDTTALNVQANYFPIGGAVYDEFYQGLSAYKFFQPKDNMIIKSFGIFLPYCFTYGIIEPEFQLAWWQNPNESVITPIAPPDGRIIHPIPNYEMEINSYVPFNPPDPTQEASIGLNGITFNISMVGVPDDFHEEEIQIFPWIKVLHNLPLEN